MSEKIKNHDEHKIPKYEQLFRLYGIEQSQRDKLEKFGIWQKASDWVDQKREFEVAMGYRQARPEVDDIPKNRVVIVGATAPTPNLSNKNNISQASVKQEPTDLVPALWVIDYWYDSSGKIRSDAEDIPLFIENNGALEASDFLDEDQLDVVNELVRDKWEAKYMTNAPEISIPDMDDTLTDVPV